MCKVKRAPNSPLPRISRTFCSVNCNIQSERWVLISFDKWGLGWWGIWERLGKKKKKKKKNILVTEDVGRNEVGSP